MSKKAKNKTTRVVCFGLWTQLEFYTAVAFRVKPCTNFCPTVFESSTVVEHRVSAPLGCLRWDHPEAGVGVAWHNSWAGVKVSADFCLGFVRGCVRELTTSRRSGEVSPAVPDHTHRSAAVRGVHGASETSAFLSHFFNFPDGAEKKKIQTFFFCLLSSPELSVYLLWVAQT